MPAEEKLDAGEREREKSEYDKVRKEAESFDSLYFTTEHQYRDQQA
jgi:hypothetical protein